MSNELSGATWDGAVRWLRNQPDQQQLVRDCYYDDPLPAAAERYRQSGEWNAIRDFLPGSGGRALDVGAGRGIASYALASEGFHVIALEPDPSDIVGAGAIRSLASQSGLSIQAVEEFSEKLPFPNDSFDVLFARAVLHHARNLEGACREFYRVLKPGGLLLAVREHVISHPGDLAQFLDQHPLHRLYGGENAFLLDRYRSAISAAEFEVIAVLSPWHSEINFFPQTEASLKQEIVSRAAQCSTLLGKVLGLALECPGIWPLACSILERVDHRPGRLYSFVARKS
jgi:SAM-dependent methyltransferase